MDEQRQREIDAAWQTWRDAEKAYREEAGLYVGMWWHDEPPKMPEKALDHAGIATLNQLLEAIKSTRDAYYEIVKRYYGG